MGRPVKPVMIPLGSSHPPPRPPLQSPWDAWEGDVSSGGSEIFSLAHLEAAVPTLTAFMQDFYLPYVKLRKRTWAKDEELFRLRLKKAFAHLPLDRITRQQIQAFHTGLKEEGLAAASSNHHMKMLRHALNLAVERKLLEKNP